MAKSHTQYVCQRCGRITAAYVGKCPQCGEFGTMVEQVIAAPAGTTAARRPTAGPLSTPQRLADITSDGLTRLPLPLAEFSRVLGGGIVPGSLVLVGGDPGIGKSTLLLEVAAMVANNHGRTLYISGEESLRQIKMRADRLSINAQELFLVTETNLNVMLQHIEQFQPLLVIVDSIQTTYLDDLQSSAGSVSQVRECASRFQELAKNLGVTVFLVGHVTKEGAIAGPRVLEHIVDTVLYLEGDPFHTYRLLRSVKNRFGATSEVGVFEMVEQGLKEVLNPSEAFLAERQVNAPGSAIAVTIEGTRPLLVEIQALASTTTFTNPRRTANGIDYNRLLLLTAVLTRRVNLRLHDKDVFANVIGGLQIDEPAADLSVAVAIASSVRDRPVHADMAFIGEIGLSGELRAVSQLETRLREALKLGFKRCVVPRSTRKQAAIFPEGLEVIGCRSLPEALQIALLPE
ncbi:MAG: DNA repair protein RadA [Chloroflexi bacterium]|nr:DNA repair protein RadA [Chloroflexota bacterium]MCI0580032.1 DNA repair protein RadA [Chloroflexota bacterium]MCI0646773.1 DNA repair protein RadA [Chloroflexota bacterium]MCI0730199.1 DNA repair protein RadA [Chloroflexota bacterium]